MNILALETSGKSGSVAALTAGHLVSERLLPSDRRSAQSLAPALDDCLAEAGWKPSAVELVVVTTGPGSFTGLRVGVTSAKIFAYVAGCQVLGVDTLQVMAGQLGPGITDICSVIDAQRQQVFAAWFRTRDDGRVSTLQPTSIIGHDQWLAELAPSTLLTGTGLAASRGKLVDRLPAGVQVADRSLWSPRAAAVGRLGWLDYQDGRRDDIWNLLPNYFRKSAAEEKRDGPGGAG